MKIITNNHERDVLSWWDLTDKERKAFDYLIEREEDGVFFRYMGEVYDLGEFMRVPNNEPARQELNELREWDGYLSDSFFSGIVVKYRGRFESVVVGRYCS